jgi:hypothetical protein
MMFDNKFQLQNNKNDILFFHGNKQRLKRIVKIDDVRIKKLSLINIWMLFAFKNCVILQVRSWSPLLELFQFLKGLRTLYVADGIVSETNNRSKKNQRYSGLYSLAQRANLVTYFNSTLTNGTSLYNVSASKVKIKSTLLAVVLGNDYVFDANKLDVLRAIIAELKIISPTCIYLFSNDRSAELELKQHFSVVRKSNIDCLPAGTPVISTPSTYTYEFAHASHPIKFFRFFHFENYKSNDEYEYFKLSFENNSPYLSIEDVNLVRLAYIDRKHFIRYLIGDLLELCRN